jgi:hypothetical protein
VVGGELTYNTISYERRRQEITSLLKKLKNPQEYTYYKRSRGQMTFSTGNPDLNKKNAFVLNEAFCAEKDVGSASRCRIAPEGEDWGIFKSSGLIISTGKFNVHGICYLSFRNRLFGVALLSAPSNSLAAERNLKDDGEYCQRRSQLVLGAGNHS